MFSINATNLHVGGGVQVATSFISELISLIEKDFVDGSLFNVFVSEKVSNCLDVTTKVELLNMFIVENVHGFSKPSEKTLNIFRSSDVTFTIFGPCYFSLGKSTHVCGFAQPWILYPDNEVYLTKGMLRKLLIKSKYFIQYLYFKSSDVLVVEANHVENQLRKLGYNRKIEVVPNCVSSFYSNADTNVVFGYKGKKTIGFIGRAYEHKNLAVLKDVNNILLRKYNQKINFLFTLSDLEMLDLKFDIIENFYSVGEIKPADCIKFYNSIDATIFPSFLECFSATPIESIKMNKPIIGSDRHFLKEFAKEAALYFDPQNPEDIAEKVNEFFSSKIIREKLLSECIRVKQNLHDQTPENRANQYINIMENHSAKKIFKVI
ncbi:glycosyltransferase [Vibrio campbellii]|uniref:glycosyltransferase n=1 Tax=Vibrio campbellii TaxID=680 RepID=UPI0038575D49